MIVAVTEDFDACMAIRQRVFVEEQNVPPELEHDEYDATAVHLLARDADGRAVGTARLLIDGAAAKIGRVAVVAEARGTGAGLALMRAALAELRHRGVAVARLDRDHPAWPPHETIPFRNAPYAVWHAADAPRPESSP